MTENEGGPTTDPGGTPEPTHANRDRDPTGKTGNAAVKSEKNPPGERGEPTDDQAAIDLDSARDRAS